MDELDEQLHYVTLHRDIGLVQEDNGLWDIGWSNDDYVLSSGLDSLYNACVFSLLTAYNEIGRHGVVLYDGFGNKSYSLLKANKDNLTLHKLHSYFMDCLMSMRRVNDVLELEIIEDHNGSLYTYKVFFRVLSITNEIIEGMVDLTDKIYQKPTILELESNDIDNETLNNNQITCTLTNKQHEPIPYQVIRIYIDNTLTDRQITNENGQATFTISLNNITSNIINVKLETEPTLNHQTSTTSINTTVTTFQLTINENGELIYKYNDETPHPDFTVNEDGELIMTYDDNLIKFNTININKEGYLIMTI